MTRNLRALGLAFLAALAIGSVVPAAASAQSFIFSSDSSSTAIGGTGEGSNVLTANAGTLNCSEVSYTGSQSGTEASELNVTPTYSSCTFAGISGATVTMNGCSYRFNAGTIESGSYNGSMDIVCPGEAKITAVAKIAGVTKCTATIPAQTGLKSVVYKNVGEGARDLTISSNLTGIKYSQTAGSGLGACKTESNLTNGTRSTSDVFGGTDQTKGENEEVAFAVTVGGTAFTIAPVSINFSKKKKGDRDTFTVTNNYALTKYISAVEVVDIAEAVDNTDFEVFATTCSGALGSTMTCEVTIEYITNTHSLLRWLRVKWTGFWPWSATHWAKADIVS